VSVISTDTVRTDLDRTDGPSKVRKAGIVITVLVTAFLAFDAAGKLAGVSQVKAATQALGFPAGQALVMGVVLAVCVAFYVIPRTAARSRPTCASRPRCSRTRCSPCTSAS
jgi:hypothetical protein